MSLIGTKQDFVNVNNTLLFYYDADGSVTSFKYNDTMYYYIKNLQGNVVKIMRQSGTVVASYVYDAWGNIKSETGETAITSLNPFKYRGYVYDSESGLYYLRPRYYDPVTHRFINADDRINNTSNIIGSNLFAYCNNPIINYDSDGHLLLAAIGIVVAAVVTALLCTSSSSHKNSTNTSNNKLPITGNPNSTSSSYDDNGNLKQERSYDEDGKAKTDTDYGHAEHRPDLDSPHYHDWDWSTGQPVRGEARNTVISVCGITVSTVAIVYLAINDATIIGVADDAAIPVFAYTIYSEVIYLME